MKKPLDARLRSIMRKPAAVGAPETAPKTYSRMTERRAVRRAGFKFAAVHCENGAVISCIVVNHDKFGVRLRFAGEASLPQQLLIVIPEIALRRRAVLKWRRGCDAGLEFLDADDQSEAHLSCPHEPRQAAQSVGAMRASPRR